MRRPSARGVYLASGWLIATAAVATSALLLPIGSADRLTVLLLSLSTVLVCLALRAPAADAVGCPLLSPPAALAFATMLVAPAPALVAFAVTATAHVLLQTPSPDPDRADDTSRAGRRALRITGLLAALIAARGLFVLLSGAQLAGNVVQSADLPALAAAGVLYFLATAALGGQSTRWLTELSVAPLAVVVVQFSPWLAPAVIPIMIRLHRHFSPRATLARQRPLSQLPDRVAFGLGYEAARREGVPMAVLLVGCLPDPDGPLSKPEPVPPVVAERIRQSLRKEDTLARLDESTFGILARLDASAPLQEAERLAQRVVSSVQDAWTTTGMTARLGMSLSPLHGNSAELLLARAARALQVACDGPAMWRVFDTYMQEPGSEQPSLLEELRTGLEMDELELRYQPKLDLQTNEIIGVEALARWRHPRRGILGPAEFIPLAESGGLMAPLTLPLLDKALAQTAAWLERGWQLSVAVNLSATHLSDLGLPEQVADALSRHRVPAELLTLEVTESTIMSDPSRAIRVLQELRAQGIRTSIDDYGTGYSSLSFLRQLQVDELKIDGSFIRHLSKPDSEADADGVIVASTINLAHNLGLRVVAEGVEDPDAWRRLADLGCDVVQGYLLSPPQAAESLTMWLESRPVALRARAPRTAASRLRSHLSTREVAL